MARQLRLLWLLTVAWGIDLEADSKVEYGPSVQTGTDGAFVDCPCYLPLLVEQSHRGSHCKAWNLNTPGNCSSEDPPPPSWCEKKWCYVDPKRCSRFSLPSSDPLLLGVHYSYETCGDRGSHFIDWNSVPLTRKLNRPLYIWASGFEVKDYTNLRSGMNLDMRASLTFAHVLLEQLGVKTDSPGMVQYRQLSNYSRQHHPHSSYTACVYDIALGNVDLCVGPVWDTDERRAMNVSFTGSIFFEEMSLLMPDSFIQQPSFSNIFFKTFEPFSKGLWAVIVATIALSCLAMIAFDHWFTPSTDYAAKMLQQKSVATTTAAWLHSFMAGEVTFMPVSSGGKVFSVGYGFFVLVCISCYTANMATILIGEDQNPSRIDTVQDALQQGKKVCYHAAMPINTVTQIYKGLDTLGIPVDGSKAGLGGWLDAGCEVSILSEMMMADEWANKTHCDYFLKKQSMMIVPNGFYSSNELGHEISWMASKMRMDGTWGKVFDQVKKPSLCASRTDSSSQLNANHMLGPLGVLFLAFLAGLAVHSYELRNDVDCSSLGLLAAEEDSDGDNDTESGSSSPYLQDKVIPGLARLQAQLQMTLEEIQELRVVPTPTKSSRSITKSLRKLWR